MSLVFILSFSGCGPENSSATDALRLMVPADTPAEDLARWQEIYRGMEGMPLEITSVSGAHYRVRIWSTLLSGGAEWDAILLDGKWVHELAEYRAILRVATNEVYPDAVFTELTVEGKRVAIAYQVDIPLIIFRKKPDPALDGEIQGIQHVPYVPRVGLTKAVRIGGMG